MIGGYTVLDFSGFVFQNCEKVINEEIVELVKNNIDKPIIVENLKIGKSVYVNNQFDATYVFKKVKDDRLSTPLYNVMLYTPAFIIGVSFNENMLIFIDTSKDLYVDTPIEKNSQIVTESEFREIENISYSSTLELEESTHIANLIEFLNDFDITNIIRIYIRFKLYNRYMKLISNKFNILSLDNNSTIGMHINSRKPVATTLSHLDINEDICTASVIFKML